MVIGAVLVHGAKAPKLVSREMVASMRPWSVVADVAISTRRWVHRDGEADHDSDRHLRRGGRRPLLALPTDPGAVARTSTLALTSATLPYLIQIAEKGIEGAAADPRRQGGSVDAARGPCLEARGRGPRPLLHRPEQDTRVKASDQPGGP